MRQQVIMTTKTGQVCQSAKSKLPDRANIFYVIDYIGEMTKCAQTDSDQFTESRSQIREIYVLVVFVLYLLCLPVLLYIPLL
jgi:hypothetical protein